MNKLSRPMETPFGSTQTLQQQINSMKRRYLILLFAVFSALINCSEKPEPGKCTELNKEPQIFPDYAGITLPPNIAPLNFYINEEGTAFYVKIFSEGTDTINCTGKIAEIPLKKWRNLLQKNQGKKLFVEIYARQKDKNWIKYKTIINTISKEKIDNYLAYRLIHPGYEDWREMGLYQRNLENFEENQIIFNRSIDENCLNCHTFSKNNPENMIFHVRGSHGGTILVHNNKISRLNLGGKPLISGGVYPSWNADGNRLAFSVNKITQLFHARNDKNIIVMDTLSDIIVYDVEKNTILTDNRLMGIEYMETFPTWSPDGKYIYFCRAGQINDTTKYYQVKYDLMRVQFNNATNSFGRIDTVIQSKNINGSISFPRISPDGKNIMFTLADYGTFPIWHEEADLYLLNLNTNNLKKLESNSDQTESFHDWSSGGKWYVFSSKRLDGQWGRSFFSYIDENGKSTKPFILPQKDPHFYETFLKSYNTPQLITSAIKQTPARFTESILGDSIQALIIPVEK
ncbi:MAG: cytochrome C biosynthesis protein [Bacteroidales bacterium]